MTSHRLALAAAVLALSGCRSILEPRPLAGALEVLTPREAEEAFDYDGPYAVGLFNTICMQASGIYQQTVLSAPRLSPVIISDVTEAYAIINEFCKAPPANIGVAVSDMLPWWLVMQSASSTMLLPNGR